MKCRMNDLKNKEVIHIETGVKLGYVDDIIVDISCCRLLSIVIYGKLKFFGLFGRGDDLIIKWNDIEVIGKDTLLVRCKIIDQKCQKGGIKFISSLFK